VSPTAGSGGRRPRTLYPHLFVRDASAAVEFYCKAFGGVELYRNVLPNGMILYLEMALGECRLQLSEEASELNALSPQTAGAGVPLLLTLEVDDVDGVVRTAVFAGATVEMPAQEMFFGERYGIVRDPFGYRWALATSRQELTPDEVDARTPPEASAGES
jgi:PhnB protein